MKEKKKSELSELVIEIVESQQKINNALIADLELLRNHIVRIESYLRIVEARREVELLKGKDK
jgi:hypothetical protein